jgi:hypothetical protein
MAMYQKQGDEALVPLFRNQAVENKLKSAQEGRPIYDDLEVVDIRFPGSRNYGTYPVREMSHWISDPFTGEQRSITYAERFAKQYQQFAEHREQTKSGTPLEFAGFLTEARRSELKSQNIYTVEVLAAIEGTELRNLGPGGRDLKTKAMDYIAHGRANAADIQLQAEVDALRAKMQVLEDDNAALKNRALSSGEAKFEAMTLEQLREFIRANTGHSPAGLLNKKALIRLAMEVPAAKDMA